MAAIYTEAFGCSSNFADSEIALGLLKRAGFELVDEVEKADLVAIFTCSVKVPTVQRMIYRIQKLSKTRKPLIVAGCMPKTDREILEKIAPQASLLGPDCVEKIVEIAKSALLGKKAVFLKDLRKPKLCLPRLRKNPLIGIVPISIGCLSNCSYCSVKFARGRLFSYPPELIVKEVQQSLREGCKEFYITSQDNSCYGLDIGTNLAKLLNKICQIDGKFFVRVGMMNPMHAKQILNELIDAYKNEKIFKFLHLPVQSGSNKVLKLMNRGYTIEDFEEIVERFKNEFPHLTLATDLMVGFPCESAADFKKTLELVKKFEFDIVNISKFGPRPGTAASYMKQINRETIAARTETLYELVRSRELEINKKWIGWQGECLIDEKGSKEGTWIGRNFAYKPIVIRSEKNIFGRFLNVKIVDAKSNYLLGEVLANEEV